MYSSKYVRSAYGVFWYLGWEDVVVDVAAWRVCVCVWMWLSLNVYLLHMRVCACVWIATRDNGESMAHEWTG